MTTICTICDEEIGWDESIRKWTDGSGYAHTACINKKNFKGVPRGSTVMEQIDADKIRSKQPIPEHRNEL